MTEEKEFLETVQGPEKVYAWADGEVVRFPFADEQVSEKDQRMKSLVVMKIDGDQLYAPADARLLAYVPEQNLVILGLDKGLQVALKMCMGAVNMAQEATLLAEVGSELKAGQPVIQLQKPVQATSKMLLVEPETIDAFGKLQYQPARKPGAVFHQEALLSK